MATTLRIYLAGQSNEQEHNWKEPFKERDGFTVHDWEFDSDQTSPDTFFPDDLRGIRDADIMIANPGKAPSEGTWIEIGYFYGLHTKKPGDFCSRLIIIWPQERKPEWSMPFVKKTGHIVATVDEALGVLDAVTEDIRNGTAAT